MVLPCAEVQRCFLCTWDPNSVTTYGSCHTLCSHSPQSPTSLFQVNDLLNWEVSCLQSGPSDLPTMLPRRHPFKTQICPAWYPSWLSSVYRIKFCLVNKIARPFLSLSPPPLFHLQLFPSILLNPGKERPNHCPPPTSGVFLCPNVCTCCVPTPLKTPP